MSIDAHQFGTLTRTIVGKFSRWRKGERVKVRVIEGQAFIERVHWRGSLVALSNTMAGVPLAFVKIDNTSGRSGRPGQTSVHAGSSSLGGRDESRGCNSDTVASQVTPAGISCRICGCVEHDCTWCEVLTGVPCHWAEPGLCSACEPLARNDAGRARMRAYLAGSQAGYQIGRGAGVERLRAHARTCMRVALRIEAKERSASQT